MIKPFAASNEGHLCYGQSHNAWDGGGVRAKIIDGDDEFRLIFEAAMLLLRHFTSTFKNHVATQQLQCHRRWRKKESHRFETL
jgi:hypothetical protein